jgi:Dolichyl-phosphate-mannose-protein mannosyltransferase
MASVEILPSHKATRKDAPPVVSRLGGAVPLILLAAGLLVRLLNAAYRFLNADEVLHYFLSVEPSFLATYRASLTTAHPPLLILFLHYWGGLAHSEFLLRLPLVLAGTGFCWAMYAWLKLVTDADAALFGLILFLFSPALIIVSAEIRQYDLLLLFSGLSLYLLERGLQRDSIWSMLLSSLSLYLALLSHYSSLIFALTLGFYALVRLATTNSRSRLVFTWVAGQIGALALIAFLFTHHVPLMRARGAWEGIADTYLRRSVLQPGQEHVLGFIARAHLRLFHYLFSQSVVGVLALLLFIAGVVLVFRRRTRSHGNLGPADWHLGSLFVFALIVNCALGVFRVYPYGGTRHNSYLSIFVFPAVAIAISRFRPQWNWQKLAAAGVILAICNFFPAPLGEYIPFRDQSRAKMAAAIHTLQQMPAGSVIFTDHEGALELSYYLCHDKSVVQLSQPLSDFFSADCAQFAMVSVGQWIFKGDSFEPDLKGARQLYGWQSGTAIWFVQAGWFIDKEPAVRKELKEVACVNPQPFGRNIFVCPVRVP